MNQRAKGARIERAARDYLRECGIECHRAQQYCGRAGHSDVTLTVGECFVEVKGGYTDADVASALVEGWVTKAVEQADGKPWLILWKPDRRPWRVLSPRMGLVGLYVGERAQQVVMQACDPLSGKEI